MSLPTPPKTLPILLDAYRDLNQLIHPPPSTFPYPLIDSFARAHDPLIEEQGHKIFTASMALREAGVHVERATREIAKVGMTASNVAEEGESSIRQEVISLSELKKARLRAMLQSFSKSPISRESLRRAYQERRAMFDTEINREEEEALEDFKRGLREAVLLSPGV